MTLRQKELRDLPAGKHHDTGPNGVRGLLLRVQESGSRSWILRVSVKGKRTEIGLGSLHDTPLSLARERAIATRQAIRAGEDPIRTKRDRKRRQEADLRSMLEAVIATREATWRSSKHAAQWRSAMELNVPSLLPRPIAEINAGAIAEALRPIWLEKSETARRVLQRIGLCVEYARAHGLYSEPSPIAGARAALPRQNGEKKHFEAVALADAPALFKRIAALESPSAWALQFAILTAARSGPVRFMSADQVEGDIWTAPAELMKMNRPHRTPLVAEALELIERGKRLRGSVVFPSLQKGKALSDMALLEALRGVAPGVTVHGWRSVFTDWCRREGIDFELQELALAHILPDKVRQAYARDDLLDRRRPVMEAWRDFLVGGK